MNNSLKNKLIKIAQKNQIRSDPSHDFEHVLRVLYLAEKIAEKEKADLNIIIPAALFHDTVVYKKNSPKSKKENEESAEFAAKILENIKEYPKDKIENVKTCIKECSFSKKIKPNLLESKVLQDADLLESTGAISIMRTFSSGGQINRSFYNRKDPFRKKTKPRVFDSSLDLFFTRLLIINDRINTNYAKNISKKRTEFLKFFLKQIRNELKESGRLK